MEMANCTLVSPSLSHHSVSLSSRGHFKIPGEVEARKGWRKVTHSRGESEQLNHHSCTQRPENTSKPFLLPVLSPRPDTIEVPGSIIPCTPGHQKLYGVREPTDPRMNMIYELLEPTTDRFWGSYFPHSLTQMFIMPIQDSLSFIPTDLCVWTCMFMYTYARAHTQHTCIHIHTQENKREESNKNQSLHLSALESE